MNANGGTNQLKSVLLCLATEKGFEALEASLSHVEQTRLHICTFRETKVERSFFDRICELTTSQELPLIRWSDFKRDPVKFLEQEKIEGILCIGWRYLIPDNVVRWLDGNVVVAHDSLLPQLRGFAPLPTALIAGEKNVGVTFLRAGKGIDDGDILWQESIEVSPRDTIADLIRRTIPFYRDGAERFLKGELEEGTPQDDSQATYSIWRDELDYRIDWSQDSHAIERTIRALGDPYLGAQCRLDNKTVVIHEAVVVPDIHFAIRQPGKIWALDERGCPTVVCGTGMLRVVSAEVDGESVIPMSSLRVRFG